MLPMYGISTYKTGSFLGENVGRYSIHGKYSMIIWLVVWNILYFSIQLGIIIPVDELIFFKGVGLNHQPLISDESKVSVFLWGFGLANLTGGKNLGSAAAIPPAG